MASKPIVALSGKQLAGKDTVAVILAQAFPQLHRHPFALAIKREYAHLHDVDLEEIEEHKASHRPGLIELGQSRRRENPDYWIEQTLNAPLPSGKTGLLVADLRMRREYDTLRRAGAFCIRVEATEAVRAERGQVVMGNDPTECELDAVVDWDMVVENNGSYQDLELWVEERLLPAVEAYLQG